MKTDSDFDQEEADERKSEQTRWIRAHDRWMKRNSLDPRDPDYAEDDEEPEEPEF